MAVAEAECKTLRQREDSMECIPKTQQLIVVSDLVMERS